MYQDIDTTDRINVLLRAGIKVLRGLVRRPFLKEVHGLLLIGRKVQISQGKQIRCGRNVKFEDYAEIQGLSRDGLSFGDNVTIGRGVMIRPSSYYGKDLGAGLSMGDNSSIGPYAYVGCAGKIVIGTNVMFGPFCRLFAENHFLRIQSVRSRARACGSRKSSWRMTVGSAVM